MNIESVFNKGVPVELPSYDYLINLCILKYYAKNKQEFEKSISHIIDNIFLENDDINIKTIEPSIFLCSEVHLIYDSKTKSNKLVFDLKNMLKENASANFNIPMEILNNETMHKLYKQLSKISSEMVLKNKSQSLYDVYLIIMKYRQKILKNDLKKFNNNIAMFKDYMIKNGEKDSTIRTKLALLKITDVNKFCKLYSSFYISLLDNYDTINEKLNNIPLENLLINSDNFLIEELELNMVYTYILMIKCMNNISDKQKYLYYVTSFFKENKNKNKINETKKHALYDNKEISYNDLYNEYIDILVNNPELKIVTYDRDTFSTFTQEEIDEYMDLELSEAKANWAFFDNKEYNERIAMAIHNETKNIKDPIEKEKKKLELKKLYLEKKNLFENSDNYRKIMGINNFDGYIAYVYPNGKVVLEKFFDKSSDGKETIAINQAIYVMNIEEFDTLTNLSKSTLIREKLCKRFIHKGNWQEKVKNEINESGYNPYNEYNNLVKAKKINDIY